MQKYQNNIQDVGGNAIVGASVLVVNYPAGTMATIYSDNGVTVAANPLATDKTGSFWFYAPSGHYSLQVSRVGLAGVTVSDIILNDDLPASLPTSLPAGAGVLWNNGGVLSVS